MQWGDLSFQTDLVADFVAEPKQITSNLRTIKPIQRIGQKKIIESSNMNSRTMKLQSLSAIYSREHSPVVFNEMMEEMASMQKYDSSFKQFNQKLNIQGKYDPENIQFDCLRNSITAYE